MNKTIRLLPGILLLPVLLAGCVGVIDTDHVDHESRAPRGQVSGDAFSDLKDRLHTDAVNRTPELPLRTAPAIRSG